MSKQWRIGDEIVDTRGRTWRKVRRIPDAEYQRVLEAVFVSPFRGLSEDAYRCLGYQLVTTDASGPG
jgi:hypothetical protein